MGKNMYEEIVKSYLKVFNLIKTELGNNSHWETNLNVIVITLDESDELLSLSEICARFQINEEQAKAFLVVDSCLSNNLYELIEDQEYESWSINGNTLVVNFTESVSKTYTSDDICRLLITTAAKFNIQWTYESLCEQAEFFFGD